MPAAALTAILLTVVLMVVAWFWLRRRGLLTVRHLVTVWAGCGYLVAIAALTLFPSMRPARAHEPTLILVPVVTIDPPDFVLNVLMTMPLGVLLALIARIEDVRGVARWALLASATVELLQLLTNLLFHGGRTADVNDLLSNTAGAVLGLLLLRAVTRVPAVAAMVERFRVAPEPPAPATISGPR